MRKFADITKRMFQSLGVSYGGGGSGGNVSSSSIERDALSVDSTPPPRREVRSAFGWTDVPQRTNTPVFQSGTILPATNGDVVVAASNVTLPASLATPVSSASSIPQQQQQFSSSPTLGSPSYPHAATHVTFAHQMQLERLPVPTLEETCQKYLRTLEPLLSDAEFAESKAAVEEFLNDDISKKVSSRVRKIGEVSLLKKTPPSSMLCFFAATRKFT